MNTVGNNGFVNGGCSDPLTLAPCVNSPLRGAGKPQIAEERSFITGIINHIFLDALGKLGRKIVYKNTVEHLRQLSERKKRNLRLLLINLAIRHNHGGERVEKKLVVTAQKSKLPLSILHNIAEN